MAFEIALRHTQGSFGLDVNFSGPAGITVLFGRSGSGKSTIVRSVAGLVRPDTGRIQVRERVLLDTARSVDLPAHKRRVGYVFQEGLLFPHLNVRNNLLYGQRFAPRGAKLEDFDHIVELLGIEALLERSPSDLSGGEKQRVAIGRALLAGPDVLLADEPLSALDEPRKAEILPYFERMRDELNVPILYVSHSPEEVARLATHVVVLDDGKVIREGSAETVLADPAVTPVGVRGAGALVRASVVRHHDDGLTELCAGGVTLFVPEVSAATGAELRLRVAAHDVVIAISQPRDLSALNIVPAEVVSVRSGHGPAVVLTLATPLGTLLARITKRSLTALGLKPGTECHAVIKSMSIARGDLGVEN